MIKEGVLEDPKVDAIFGLYLLPDIPQGRQLLSRGCNGPGMRVRCRDQRQASPRATPCRGIDALLASCNFVNMLQGVLTPRSLPVRKLS